MIIRYYLKYLKCNWYVYFLIIENSENSKKGKSFSTLAAITLLKKLCNHPDLVYDKILGKCDGFENAAKLMPANYSTRYVTEKICRFIIF